MKKLFFLIMTLAFIGCESKDSKALAIENQIIKNAMGNDIGYEPKNTTKVADVTYRDMLDVFLIEMNTSEKPIDSMILYTQSARSIQKREDNVELYHLFDHYVSRLENYRDAQNKDEAYYSVFKHDYSIINPLFDNTKVDVTNYYFFTPKDSLIGYMSDDDFKDYKRNFIQHEAQPYEKMYYKIYSN